MNKDSGVFPSMTEEKDSGMAVISHDLRTALAGVMGGVSLIETENVSAETAAQLGRIRSSAQLLNELLNLLFEIAPDEDAPAIDLASEIDSCRDIWDVQLKEQGQSFVVNMPADLHAVKSNDRLSFRRVLNNLVSNAGKYATDSDVTLTIANAENNRVSFEVRDFGSGFSDEALEMLFQFGGRPDNSKSTGTGLGLYIAQTLVEGMGGTIRADNHPDGGARITFSLPAEVTQKAVKPAAKPVADGLPDLTGTHILLAEDNMTNQLVVTQMLKNLGATFVVASDGVEALECFEKEDFDLVLLDIEMPRKSGLEVLQEVRARSDAKADATIVALTAYVMQEHRDRINEVGATGIIAKPIEGVASFGNNILQYLDSKVAVIVEATEENGIGQIGLIDEEIFESLKSMMGDDAMSELLEKVYSDLTTIHQDLIQAESDGDATKIGTSSHTLVSVAGAIGATNLQKTAQELNSVAKTDDLAKRQELNLRCIDGTAEVMIYVKSNQ